ncbi:MAG: NapC/NirT family cytochrome c [Spirochaetota bacterium]
MIFIIVIILLTVGLIILIIVKPSMTDNKGGKILVFFGFFILPGLAIVLGASSHFESSKSTEFCLSCHVMEPYGKSLRIDDQSYLPAKHFQNNLIPRKSACYTCHTNYTMFGDVQSKLRGLRHVYINYLGKIPEKLKLYTPYDKRECLHCHNGSRAFMENPVHEGILGDITSGTLSCLECHTQIHGIDELDNLKFWQSEAGK